MRYYKILALLSVCSLLYACSEKEPDAVPKDGGISLDATIADDLESKSSVTDKGVFTWSEGDEISVFTTKRYFRTFVIKPEDAGKKKAVFTAELAADEAPDMYAVYPAGKHQVSDAGITVNLPSLYGSADTGYSRNTNAAMVSTIEAGNSLAFRHIGGVLRFIINNVPDSAAKFIFRTAEVISGSFIIEGLGTETPVIRNREGNSGNEVAIAFKSGSIQKEETFYIPLPAGNYSGFTIEIQDVSGNVLFLLSSANEQTMNRNTLVRVPRIDIVKEPDEGSDDGSGDDGGDDSGDNSGGDTGGDSGDGGDGGDNSGGDTGGGDYTVQIETEGMTPEDWTFEIEDVFVGDPVNVTVSDSASKDMSSEDWNLTSSPDEEDTPAEKPKPVDGVLFQDDFEQESDEIDMTKWTYCYPGEAAWCKYMNPGKDNVYVKDGKLILKAEKVGDTYKCGGVTTQNKHYWNNCKVEVNAKMAENAQGGWQAVWMQAQKGNATYSGWPNAGEIDIMEHLNHDTYIYNVVHTYWTDLLGHQNGEEGEREHLSNIGVFRTYAVDITDEALIFYVDGKESFRYSNRHLADETTSLQYPFSYLEYYLMINFALGGTGTWPGAITDSQLPVYMEIDWVKVTSLE